MSFKNKIAIIGWDSATFDVLNPLMDGGALPNLQAIIKKGAAGTLISTIQPVTPTAWSSFSTGVNPGKHGVFDFVRLEASGDFQINSGAQVRIPTIWSRLSQAGKRVTVVNVPMTYPPEAINGRLVTGMDSPVHHRAYTYPPELADEIMDRFANYKVDIHVKPQRGISVEAFTDHYVQELIDMTRMQAGLACSLLEQEQPDFFMAVFIAPDRVQHALGTQMRGDIKPESGIGQVYQSCDEALGNIVKELDESWTILIVSDHGACVYSRVFELSTWLSQAGWLRIRPQKPLGEVLEFGRKVSRNVARKMGRLVTQRPGLQQFRDRVVWPETKAFSLGAFGNIYLNKKSRFPWGIVEEEEKDTICQEIAGALLELRDEETGQPIVEAVHHSHEIYTGPYSALAPDLLVETRHDYFVRNNLDHEEGRIVYPAGRYRGRHLSHTGRHTREGILVAQGPMIKPGNKFTTANLMDIAPTIMYLYDIPVPTEMDGRPLLEWLTDTYSTQHPVTYQSDEQHDVRHDLQEGYSTEEVDALSERLRALGYMD